MKSLLVFALIAGMMSCAKKPHNPTAANPSQGCPDPIGCTVWATRCDLSIEGVCFDRTDGHGHKQEFTKADEEKVMQHIWEEP